MIYRTPCPEGTPLIPVAYSFLEPCKVKVRNPDGTVQLIGFGIGDQVQVLEPAMTFLVCSNDRLKEIPLANGSFIVEFPEIKVERVK